VDAPFGAPPLALCEGIAEDGAPAPQKTGAVALARNARNIINIIGGLHAAAGL
jgi:hypothetical protein